MPTGYDPSRDPDGKAHFGDLLRGPEAASPDDATPAPTEVVVPATIERLRLASDRVREAERLIRRALDHDCSTAVADAIAATKAALDHLVSIR